VVSLLSCHARGEFRVPFEENTSRNWSVVRCNQRDTHGAGSVFPSNFATQENNMIQYVECLISVEYIWD
jgi:hypothetical protein